jgi:hypothetical protein
MAKEPAFSVRDVVIHEDSPALDCVRVHRTFDYVADVLRRHFADSPKWRALAPEVHAWLLDLQDPDTLACPCVPGHLIVLTVDVCATTFTIGPDVAPDANDSPLGWSVVVSKDGDVSVERPRELSRLDKGVRALARANPSAIAKAIVDAFASL